MGIKVIRPLFLGAVLSTLYLVPSVAQGYFEDQASGELNEEAAVVARTGGSCAPTVNVSFHDKGWKVETVDDPARVIAKRPMYGVVGAFTRYTGVNFRVNSTGTGCNRRINVAVNWNSQTTVFMPPVSKVGSCRYNLMLHHEMEHVKIFRQVPRDFKDQIAQIAATSNSPQRALTQFQIKITQETRRRNEQFHSFERAEPRHRCHEARKSSWSGVSW